MPLERCSVGPQPGYRWGRSGECYTYVPGDAASEGEAKRRAVLQGIAEGETPPKRLVVVERSS